MAKIIPHTISKVERVRLKNLFYAKIAKLENKKEVGDFLEDMLTESEVIMFARRLQVAKLLLEGETYFQIRKKLGVGVDTIKMIKNKLDIGSGGFLKFIKDLKV